MNWIVNKDLEPKSEVETIPQEVNDREFIYVKKTIIGYNHLCEFEHKKSGRRFVTSEKSLEIIGEIL